MYLNICTQTLLIVNLIIKAFINCITTMWKHYNRTFNISILFNYNTMSNIRVISSFTIYRSISTHGYNYMIPKNANKLLYD